MRVEIAIPFLCVLMCQPACRPSWPPDIVAGWRGGQIALADIELELEHSLDTAQSGDDLVRRYRDEAGELCVRDVLVRRHSPEIVSRFEPQDREFTRRQIAIDSWLKSRISPEAEASDEEIEAYYAANPEASFRAERRFVEHIFRRTTGEEGEGAAQSVLDEVRERFLRGESFHNLAVEFSESETASFGGIMGTISRGQLHERAEAVVFSLEMGEISQPTPVHGGLAVFVVTEIYPEKTFPLADIRREIASKLRQEKVRQRLDAIAGQTEFTDSVVWVPESDFLEALKSDDPDAVIFADDALGFTVGEWRSRLTGGNAEAQLAQYGEFLRLQKVYHHLVAGGFLDEPGVREAVDARFEKTLNDELMTQVIREMLTDRAGADNAALEAWYDENRERYQSPIELLVHLIVVPPTGEADSPAEELRAVATSYTGGDLEKAAEEYDNATVSHAWVGTAALDAFHTRVKAPLLALDPPACGPLFNIAGSLHLFCVEERKDPKQLSFDEAHDQVVEDFIAANEQRLYEEIKSEILNEVHFEFNEARVREILHAPAIQGAIGS